MNEDVSKLLNYSYFFLRYRPRTEHEMLQYLQKKAKRFHLEEEVIKKALNDLKKQGLIDDDKFISWFVEMKGSSAKKSMSMLRFELKRHGVSQDAVSRYFEDRVIDELQAAVKALTGKWRSLQKKDRKKRFEASAQFLQRKGFAYSIVKSAIAEMEEKE